MMGNIVDIIKFSASVMLGIILAGTIAFIAFGVLAILFTKVFVPFVLWVGL